jgi:biopolymer transport protein ExbD
MLTSKNGLNGKKVEMTPLIDMIFLLLIFFLVTLTIPKLSKTEVREWQFDLEVVTAEDDADVDMFIQLHQFPNDNTVYHFIIDEQMKSKLGRTEDWNEIISPVITLSVLKKKFEKVYSNPNNIPLKENGKVIISASEWIPYEKVFDVIQACADKKVTYYCVVSSFKELKDRIKFPVSREIKERKIW